MAEQISERARESGRRPWPGVTRRTAHSPKLKRGLEGIKDWTARLPGLLDHPRRRAPRSNVTELSPGWRRHDRTHLEILEHPADDDGRTLEAWIFMPQSFRLNPDTYTTRRIGSDFQSYIRLSAPELRLGDVAGELDRTRSERCSSWIRSSTTAKRHWSTPSSYMPSILASARSPRFSGSTSQGG